MRSLPIVAALVLLSTAVQAQHVQKCRPAERPNKLPSVESLLDSAEAASAFASRPLPATGVLFSIVSVMDSVQVVRLIEPATVDSFPQALGVFRRTLDPQRADEPWAVRVRVRPGGAMAVERAQYCAPEMISSAQEINRFDLYAEDRLATTGGHPVRVTVQLSLSELGDVTRMDIVRSSGIQDLDTQIAQSFARQKFLPALLDSVPVRSWIRTDGKTLKL